MFRLPTILIGVCLLCACASQSPSGDAVRDEMTAIDIGRKACREKAGVRFFVDESKSGWKARLEGDHWRVWWEPYYALQAYMEISVSTHGKTTECIRMVT